MIGEVLKTQRCPMVAEEYCIFLANHAENASLPQHQRRLLKSKFVTIVSIPIFVLFQSALQISAFNMTQFHYSTIKRTLPVFALSMQDKSGSIIRLH